MDRLFLDANILFSAAHKPDARVFRLWRLEDVVLYSSRYALEEARFNLASDDELRRLTRLAETCNSLKSASAPSLLGCLCPKRTRRFCWRQLKPGRTTCLPEIFAISAHILERKSRA